MLLTNVHVLIRSLICFQFKTSTTRSTLQPVSDVWSFGYLMSREKTFRIFRRFKTIRESFLRIILWMGKCKVQFRNAHGALSMREGHTYIIIGPERDQSNPRKFSPRNSHFVLKRKKKILPRKSIQYSQKV